MGIKRKKLTFIKCQLYADLATCRRWKQEYPAVLPRQWEENGKTANVYAFVRYLSSQLLDKFVEFNGQDVLFLYSTLVLNNSNTIK